MVYAGQQQANHTETMLASDTASKKDSVSPAPTAIADLKMGFNDLFLKSADGTSINTQLNPLAISFVKDYMTKFGKTMDEMKTWGKPYFDMMDLILTQHGLPKELKYLAVIESHLKSNVKSWTGAVGPWQFMPVTARNFGLKVSKYRDERTDYFKSTHAASRYLTDLYAIYGDWLLVIAAYNGGPGNVNSAIRKSGSRDFWKLQQFLPQESKNHVKKFIATHFIMEGQGGVTTATKQEMKDMVMTIQPALSVAERDSSRVSSITGRYNSAIIIKYLQMNLLDFNRYNPEFEKKIATDGAYELRLPGNMMDLFLAKKTEILNESLQLLLNPATQETTPKKAF
jgi:membrane-bound lytic murein transglycosylase D